MYLLQLLLINVFIEIIINKCVLFLRLETLTKIIMFCLFSVYTRYVYDQEVVSVIYDKENK